MRRIFQGAYRDGSGNIVQDGTISVFLTGTETAANIYTTVAGTTAVNSVTSSSTDGSFTFYTDDFDYGSFQGFDITLSKTSHISKTYTDVVMEPIAGTYTISADKTLGSTIHLQIPYGVEYSVASGKTLTIQGSIQAGAYQIFSGDGAVAFTGDGIWLGAWEGGADTLSGVTLNMAKGGDIASASPLVVGTDGDYFDVTGTTGFAAMTVAANRHFFLQFDGALTMTHHATNLDLPGEANITTAAGDVGEFYSTGANTVQCVNYTRADGTALAGESVSNTAYGAGWNGETGVAPSQNAVYDEMQLQPKALLTAQGDIVYASAANTLARLAKGTALQQLRMNAGATAPEWDSVGLSLSDYSGTSTIVGWSSRTINVISYAAIGKLVYCIFNIEGTSNSTSTTFTLPNAEANVGHVYSYGRSKDNGGTSIVGLISVGKNSNVVTCYHNVTGGAASYTASGTKEIHGFIVYMSA
jgi:hypothetical protein